MATATAAPIETLAELIEQIGAVPLNRIRANPPPGTATEADALRLAEAADKHLCELIEGVLVEKAVGFLGSWLAAILIELIGAHIRKHRLGIVVGESGLVRLAPELVRIPDVGFYSYARLPRGRSPREPLPTLAPNLAIEVLSPSNTKKEMKRKRADYFAAGVELLWEINRRKLRATVWTGVSESTDLTPDDVLDGGDVLPGFSVRLGDLFDELNEAYGGDEGKQTSK